MTHSLRRRSAALFSWPGEPNRPRPARLARVAGALLRRLPLRFSLRLPLRLPLLFALVLLSACNTAPPPVSPPEASTVTLTWVIELPAVTPPEDDIFLSGSWNQWQPADQAQRFVRVQDRATLTLTFEKGQTVEYTFTRGSWTRREADASGEPAPNHALLADASRTIELQLAGWTDLRQEQTSLATPTPDPTLINTYDGRVQRVQLLSRALGVRKTFFIYTPPAADLDARFPVLYLFRGHEREWVNPAEDVARGNRNVIDVYEELLQAAEIGPMILVFPGISSNDNVYSGMLVNMLDPEKTHNARGVGSGRFEDFLLQDLIPFVEVNYPALPGAAHRGVDGFSLGGFMALKIATQHPDWFTTAGAYDGLFFYAGVITNVVTATLGVTATAPITGGVQISETGGARLGISLDDRAFQNSLFDPVFGAPRNVQFAAANNPANLLLNTPAAAFKHLHWFIEYGPEAREPHDSNFYRGQYLVNILARMGLVNDGGAIANGRHTWAQADQHMARTLPKHYIALTAP